MQLLKCDLGLQLFHGAFLTQGYKCHKLLMAVLI